MKKLLWVGALSALLLAACGDEENTKEQPDVENTTPTDVTTEKDETEEVENEVEEEQEDPSIGEAAVSALESNDFMKFVEEYNNLGTKKTEVWDNKLNGTTVTWTGTVVRAGTSQLFVYGGNDYNGETWDELAEENKLFYTFVAKYKEGTAEDFKKLNTGDKVTVQGNLDSRGDLDMNFNWKIYESVIQ